MPRGVKVIKIWILIHILQVFSPAKAIFAGIGVLLSVCILLNTLRSVHHDTDGSQAAKDVRADQDALFEVFERIEAFFQRLEIYPKAAFNQEMVEAITKIMVEVLNVLGIATKEIRQGRTSKLLLYKLLPLIERWSEKYLKKLIGRTDIEDALKRLDRLTQEEARMAAAQVLKVANTVDDRVQGIADTMLGVDHRVAGIDDRVADVGDRLKDVDEQVKMCQ
jgi:hypothetical protein